MNIQQGNVPFIEALGKLEKALQEGALIKQCQKLVQFLQALGNSLECGTLENAVQQSILALLYQLRQGFKAFGNGVKNHINVFIKLLKKSIANSTQTIEVTDNMVLQVRGEYVGAEYTL